MRALVAVAVYTLVRFDRTKVRDLLPLLLLVLTVEGTVLLVLVSIRNRSSNVKTSSSSRVSLRAGRVTGEAEISGKEAVWTKPKSVGENA